MGQQDLDEVQSAKLGRCEGLAGTALQERGLVERLTEWARCPGYSKSLVSVNTIRASKSFPLPGRPHPQYSVSLGAPQFKRCSGVREVKQGHQDIVEYSRSKVWEKSVSAALRNERGFLLQTTTPWQSTGNRHCWRCCTTGLLDTSWNREFQPDARNTFFSYEGAQIAEQAFQKGWGISIFREHGIIKVGRHLEDHLVQPRHSTLDAILGNPTMWNLLWLGGWWSLPP